MKKTLLSSLLLTLAFGSFSQTVIHETRTLSFGGQQRQYRLYVPASYDGSQKVPLVFVLHGLGDDMLNMEGVGMTYIADTANFIVITPQAVADPLAGTAWNSGAGTFGYYPNSNVDDVGFFRTLIDSTAAEFKIDQRRVFACGFSMGGFMTNRLACQLNDRIAAFAPVAATIGDGITCTPGRVLPIITFHGTADVTVSYDTASFGMSVPDLLTFWANNNGCTAVDTFAMPDINPNDGYTVDHFVWGSCTAGAALEHFRVYGATHTWLGPTDDIFYTAEIWKFFLRFEHPDETLGALGVEIKTSTSDKYSLAPNPTEKGNSITLNHPKETVKVSVMDVSGKIVLEQNTVTNATTLSTDKLNSGIYFLNFTATNGSKICRKFVVR